MINKNIVIQWQQANMPENSLAYQDLEEMQELALHNAESEQEAIKLVMLAIRSAAKKRRYFNAIGSTTFRKMAKRRCHNGSKSW